MYWFIYYLLGYLSHVTHVCVIPVAYICSGILVYVQNFFYMSYPFISMRKPEGDRVLAHGHTAGKWQYLGLW